MGLRIRRIERPQDDCPACRVDPLLFFRVLCSRIGRECFELVDRFLEGVIGRDEFLRELRALAESRGITERDIEELVERLAGA